MKAVLAPEKGRGRENWRKRELEEELERTRVNENKRCLGERERVRGGSLYLVEDIAGKDWEFFLFMFLSGVRKGNLARRVLYTEVISEINNSD